MSNIHNPLHPGEIVRDILMDGEEFRVTDAADHLGISRTTLSRLLNGRIGISPEMAIRLSKLLENTNTLLWMNLQRDYDIWIAEKGAKKIKVIPLDRAA